MITHQYADAFQMMTFECERCGFPEKIWNSRDGEVPFTVPCRHCFAGDMRRVRDGEDTYEPRYQPKAGERVFVDDFTERMAWVLTEVE